MCIKTYNDVLKKKKKTYNYVYIIYIYRLILYIHFCSILFICFSVSLRTATFILLKRCHEVSRPAASVVDFLGLP